MTSLNKSKEVRESKYIAKWTSSLLVQLEFKEKIVLKHFEENMFLAGSCEMQCIVWESVKNWSKTEGNDTYFIISVGREQLWSNELPFVLLIYLNVSYIQFTDTTGSSFQIETIQKWYKL